MCVVFDDVAWLGSSLGFDFLKIFIGVTKVLVLGFGFWGLVVLVVLGCGC